MLPARILLAAVALACCAWFALGGYAAHERTRLERVLAGAARLTPQQASHAQTLLDRAGTLNPDRSVALLKAGLQLHTGRPREAERTLQGRVQREPRNIDAWLLLEVTTDHRDPPVSRAAGAMVRMLAPPTAPAS